MRKYAYLKEPLRRGDGACIYKIMLYQAEEGVYLFEYDSPEAVLSSADRLYDSPHELAEDWDELLDERGWIELGDPLPDCQHDAFLPVRVKGREIGRPEWGKYELLRDGKWEEYSPS